MADEEFAQCASPFVYDSNYEFSAPQYYNFDMREEDQENMCPETWFESAAPSEPSPQVVKARALGKTTAPCNLELLWQESVQTENIPQQTDPKLPQPSDPKLTVPKSPIFETTLRSRPVGFKCKEEREAEEMANIQPFKALPLDRKILEKPQVARVTRSKVPLTEPEEFHFSTADRALLHPRPETSEELQEPQTSKRRKAQYQLTLTVPQEFQLETALRARPSTAKSRDELEAEELARIPPFKALPLNMKVLESHGELGVPKVTKRPLTEPQEFHLKTDARAQLRPPPAPAEDRRRTRKRTATEAELLQQGRITAPSPFNLKTEERGMEKERRLQEQVVAEEARRRSLRNPRAQPLPATTDMPQVVRRPQVPLPTVPEPFELESLKRHKEEVRRLESERRLAARQEAAAHEFHALPNLSNVAPPMVPEKSRKPLTQIWDKQLRSEVRAVERTQFDKQLEEKHMANAQQRAVLEARRKNEEEKEIRKLRRQMVPKALPVPEFIHNKRPRRSARLEHLKSTRRKLMR